MRTLLGLLVLVLSATAWSAEVPIKLNPLPGGKAPEELATRNVTGTCGGATVRVLGLSNEFPTSSFDDDIGRIIIRSPDGEMTLGFADVLNDYNKITCMRVKRGEVLVIESSCAGSACGDARYFLIDPKKLKYIAPVDPEQGTCNRKCAIKIVGKKLP